MKAAFEAREGKSREIATLANDHVVTLQRPMGGKTDVSSLTKDVFINEARAARSVRFSPTGARREHRDSELTTRTFTGSGGSR